MWTPSGLGTGKMTDFLELKKKCFYYIHLFVFTKFRHLGPKISKLPSTFLREAGDLKCQYEIVVEKFEFVFPNGFFSSKEALLCIYCSLDGPDRRVLKYI